MSDYCKSQNQTRELLSINNYKLAHLEHCKKPAVQLVLDYMEVSLLSHQLSTVDNTDTCNKEKCNMELRYQDFALFAKHTVSSNVSIYAYATVRQKEIQ